ncbi:hypothetical protein ACTXT7_008142 [Hymenolepis weldensis]
MNPLKQRRLRIWAAMKSLTRSPILKDSLEPSDTKNKWKESVHKIMTRKLSSKIFRIPSHFTD